MRWVVTEDHQAIELVGVRADVVGCDGGISSDRTRKSEGKRGEL